jgi:hypothetical protein
MFSRNTVLFVVLMMAVIPRDLLAQSDIALRVYVDFNGSKPSPQQLDALRSQLINADTPSDKRVIIKKLLTEDLIVSKYFERRLRNYFMGLFGMSAKDGEILSECQDSSSSPCFDSETISDFSSEPAMVIARTITGLNETDTDIRGILTNQKTLISGRMAQAYADNESLRSSVGLGNADVKTLTSYTEPDQWKWFERDPSDVGIVGSGNHIERHSGILTTPAFLMRAPSHLSRANYFYSWMLCSEVEQSRLEEAQDLKLAVRQPCAGCHSILEPLGSFWVYWRANLSNKGDELLPWILNGDESTGSQVPIDIEDKNSVHSRSGQGLFQGQKGAGVRALGDLAAADSKFPVCMATHMWQLLHGRKIIKDEAGWVELLGQKLKHQYNWNMQEIIIDIVLSESYGVEGKKK